MHNARFYTYLNKKKCVPCMDDEYDWYMYSRAVTTLFCIGTHAGLPPKLEDYQQFLSNLENLRYFNISKDIILYIREYSKNWSFTAQILLELQFFIHTQSKICDIHVQ